MAQFGFCKKGMPCMPLTPVAWVDVNKKHIIDGAPALTEDSKLACFHGGVITIVPLDAGSAEEGKMNEIVESAVEKVGLALKMAGAIADCIDVFSPGGLVKMAGKKGAAKNLKGGGNKGKGSESNSVENRGAEPSKERPSWRQSEKDVSAANPDYEKQKSFKDGEEVPYGTKGSVRPDNYKVGASIEVKNYNVTTANGRNRLVNNVTKQIEQRAEQLPENTSQKVVIDVRGQNVSNDVLREIRDSILNKTGKDVEIQFLR